MTAVGDVVKNNPYWTAAGAGALGIGGTYLATRPDDSFSGRVKALFS
jgi:hypothetical protein